MHGFSWILHDQLAGMPCPGAKGDLAEDARFLQSQGIGLLISLSEKRPDPDLLARFDIASTHLPIVDFAPPSPALIERFVAEVRAAIAAETAVGVHCAAGIGRTGTMLAAYLISEGVDAAKAIKTIREMRPGSIETFEQEDALFAYAERLKSTS